MHHTLQTSVLEVGYLELGSKEGPPAILLHGWPSDVHDWDEVGKGLAASGFHVFVPWLRGFGPTRFLHQETPRSGQQATLGMDLREFMDALHLEDALLVGYDWGGRAACVVAALWPKRVRGLVSMTGYNIQNIALSGRPDLAVQEYRLWYQWYFQNERGRTGLKRNRRDIAHLLWRLWSPNWQFDDSTFAATADSFDNPDFVEVTIHSYRHRYGNADGDPVLDEFERQLGAQPPITVPTVVLHGNCDGVVPPDHSADAQRHFTGYYVRQVIPLAGHFLSREKPEVVVDAVRHLADLTGKSS
jgi:pimeloyl-ACP methyl ester carboxylesterase